jgi:5-methyltetrahydrofolate--homocysteine methyltransferase
VSGVYLAHPDASYFAVGRLQRDQIESYAERKSVTIRTAESLLGSTLAYTPD